MPFDGVSMEKEAHRTYDLRVIETGDGSRSLEALGLNETYHSRNGAYQESMHVFIRNGLRWASRKWPDRTIKVLEVGFGTGMNAFLSYLETLGEKVRVEYTALEPHPLPFDVRVELGVPHRVGGTGHEVVFERLHALPDTELAEIHPGFTFRRFAERVQDIERVGRSGSPFHIIFYDAFAPGAQEDMWEPRIFRELFHQMVEGGALVTYCAQGGFRRGLKETGWTVQELPGPPGKREMTRAIVS